MQIEKVAVVTGASRGIGKACALGLAKAGYHIALVARSEQDLQDVAQEVEQHGVKSKVICVDISEFSAIPPMINTIVKEWSRIDVLVNNAGILKMGTLSASLEDYQILFDINVKAQLVFMQAVLPIMQKQQSGYIFNIASMAGKIGYPEIGAYVSSKFALVGLSESVHEEYADQHIKVTAICPNYVATDMVKEVDVPTFKMIQPEDIANTLRWLLNLSPGAYVKEVHIITHEEK